jgi:hypothetical protein
MKFVLPVFMLFLALAGWESPQHPVATAPAQLEEGRELFRLNCSACHGDTAKGGRGPDLTSGQWKHGGTDAEIIRNTLKGDSGDADAGDCDLGERSGKDCRLPAFAVRRQWRVVAGREYRTRSGALLWRGKMLKLSYVWWTGGHPGFRSD